MRVFPQTHGVARDGCRAWFPNGFPHTSLPLVTYYSKHVQRKTKRTSFPVVAVQASLATYMLTLMSRAHRTSGFNPYSDHFLSFFS